jgi:CBS-domain-containing membrane protein
MAAFTQGRRLTEIPVAAAMARQVESCTEREDIIPVERRMAARQVRRMPVVDDDDVLIGVIGLADLARAFDQRRAGTAGAVAEGAGRGRRGAAHRRRGRARRMSARRVSRHRQR